MFFDVRLRRLLGRESGNGRHPQERTRRIVSTLTNTVLIFTVIGLKLD